jgi:hypothetical protein
MSYEEEDNCHMRRRIHVCGVSSPSYDMYPPPLMLVLVFLTDLTKLNAGRIPLHGQCGVSSSSYDMYPPPLIIWCSLQN